MESKSLHEQVKDNKPDNVFPRVRYENWNPSEGASAKKMHRRTFSVDPQGGASAFPFNEDTSSKEPPQVITNCTYRAGT